MLLEASEGDVEVAGKMLARHTAFTGKDGKEVAGKRDVSQLSEKQIIFTYPKIKKAYDEWEKKNGGKGKAKEQEPSADEYDVPDFLGEGN
jgi:hypothetical protein